MLFGLFTFFSCSEDDKPELPKPQPLPIANNITGEWVADYAIDDPQGYRWEILKFLESGVMYFSNYSETRSTSNSYVNGTYTIGDSTITTNCLLGWGGDNTLQYNTEIRLSHIDAYSMKADIWRGSEKIASNTYQKVIGSIDLDRGDITPDYSKLLGGMTPRSFHSHNPYVATVDDRGTISSQWSGSTYIDITTDKGIAALQVNVNSIFYFDYENYIGTTMKDIVKVFEERTSTEKNVMVYSYNDYYYPALQRKSGNWNQMRIRLNSTSGLVDVITLYAREDINYTDYQIEDFLNARYKVANGSESSTLDEAQQRGNKTFFFEDANLGVAWNKDSRALRIFKLDNDLQTNVDYGHFMGMEKNDVEAIMGNPQYVASNGEWISYEVNGKWTKTVVFRFINNSTKQLKSSVQVINVRLHDSFGVEEAQEKLSAKYELIDEGSDCCIYQSEDPNMRVYLYFSPTNQIQYVNLNKE